MKGEGSRKRKICHMRSRRYESHVAVSELGSLIR